MEFLNRLISFFLGEGYQDFRFFMKGLRNKGFDVKVLNKRRIQQKYGKGLYTRLAESLDRISYKRLLLILKEEEERISWLSYYDRIVVNLRHSPGTVSFDQSLQRTEKEAQII